MPLLGANRASPARTDHRLTATSAAFPKFESYVVQPLTPPSPREGRGEGAHGRTGQARRALKLVRTGQARRALSLVRTGQARRALITVTAPGNADRSRSRP